MIMTFSNLRWRGFSHRHRPRIHTAKDVETDFAAKDHDPDSAARNVLRRSLSSELKMARKQQQQRQQQQRILSGQKGEGKRGKVVRRETRRERRKKKKDREREKDEEEKAEKKNKQKEVKKKSENFKREDSALWRWPSIELSEGKDGRGSVPSKTSCSSLYVTGKVGQRAWIAGVLRDSDARSVQDGLRTSHHSDTASEHVILDVGIESTSQESPSPVLSFGGGDGPVENTKTENKIDSEPPLLAKAPASVKHAWADEDFWKAIDAASPPIPVPPAFKYDGAVRIKRYPHILGGPRPQRIRMHVGSIAEMTMLEEQSLTPTSQLSRPVPAPADGLGVVGLRVEKR
jgi:hypothetical protein